MQPTELRRGFFFLQRSEIAGGSGRPRRVDGTYVKKTRPVEGPTFNGANKILEIIVTPEPTPNPPLHIMKSPEHLGFGSNYRSLYFIFGLKVRPKMLAAC